MFEFNGEKYKTKWWGGEHLGKDFTADTETELIQGPTHTPRLAITTAYGLWKYPNTVFLIKNDQMLNFHTVHSENQVCYHNASFDIRVIEKHTGFKFHDQIVSGNVLDTRILYRLVYIAVKGYCPKKTSLDWCIKEAFGLKLDKNEDIRLTFGEYINDDGSVRYDDISKEHYEYAAKDSIATELLKQKLLKRIQTLPTSTNLSHTIQLMGEIALDDIHRRGVSVDLPYATNLREGLQADMDRNSEILLTYGLSRGKGFQEKYEIAVRHLGLDLPLSPKTKSISMKSEDLEKYEGTHFVDTILEYLKHEKLKAFLNLLTTEKVHPRYDSIKNTLRSGCSKPNIQNPPRAGGIRECFVPAKGNVFVDIDYSSIELYALAYICKKKYKHSVLYDKLQEGVDVHIYAASIINDIDEADVTKEQRQIAKIANYGLAANMGYVTFQGHMAKSGIVLPMESIKVIKNKWKVAFPEIELYWKGAQGRDTIVTDTGFVRAGCTYTAYLNTPFQSKVAEGCKIMLYNLYIEGFDTRMFVHDQVVIECKGEDAEKVLKDASKIMIDSMKTIIPDMNIKVDAQIKERHSK